MFGITNIAVTRTRLADLTRVRGLHEPASGLTSRMAFICEHDPQMLLVFDANNTALQQQLEEDLIDLARDGVIQVTMHRMQNEADGSRTATLLHPHDYIWSISSYECPDACVPVYLLAYASSRAPGDTYELFIPLADLEQ